MGLAPGGVRFLYADLVVEEGSSGAPARRGVASSGEGPSYFVPDGSWTGMQVWQTQQTSRNARGSITDTLAKKILALSKSRTE